MFSLFCAYCFVFSRFLLFYFASSVLCPTVLFFSIVVLCYVCVKGDYPNSCYVSNSSK